MTKMTDQGRVRCNLVIVASGFFVAASALLTVTPLYLRRPAGFGLYAASVLSLYAFVHPPGMECSFRCST